MPCTYVSQTSGQREKTANILRCHHGFSTRYCLRTEHRNSPLMTCYYQDLGCAFDWLKQISYMAQPIRSTTQFWVVSHNQYGISALISQRSFCGETSGRIVKCQLFSQAIIRAVTKFKLARKWRSHREFQNFLVLSVYLVSIKVTRTNICSDIKANSQPPALGGDNPELF